MTAAPSGKRWAAGAVGLGLVAGGAVLYARFGLEAAAAPLSLGVVLTAFVLGSGPLAAVNARSRLSLKWKVSGAVFLMLTILLAVALVNWVTIQYTHEQIHGVQEFRDINLQDRITRVLQEGQGPNPELIRVMQVRAQQMGVALDTLEDTQHGILSWTPALTFAGGFVAIALGVALSASTVRPLGRMSETTRRLAAGDFSHYVEVPNRDELGELAASLNNAARDLSRHQEALLEAERARALEERIALVTQAHEEERRRLSREIHDGLGPSLAALGNRLHLTRELVRTDPARAESNLDDVITSLRDHVRMTRELINELRPLDLDQLGLTGALTQYLEQFGQESGVHATLSLSGEPPKDPLTEVTVYRLAQEGLTNVRKHAQASNVAVTLHCTPDEVVLDVADDGIGFNAVEYANAPGGGIGLTSMRERAELVGGYFSIESAAGQGCRLRFRLPMKR